MVTIQGAFLDNVGASEVLLQLPEHMKLNPLLCGWVSPMVETRIREPHLMGDRGAQRLKAASSGSFITPYGWTFWQGLSCNG